MSELINCIEILFIQNFNMCVYIWVYVFICLFSLTGKLEVKKKGLSHFEFSTLSIMINMMYVSNEYCLNRIVFQVA